MHILRPSATVLLPSRCRIINARHLGHVMKMAQVSASTTAATNSSIPFRCTRRKQANPRRKNGKSLTLLSSSLSLLLSCRIAICTLLSGSAIAAVLISGSCTSFFLGLSASTLQPARLVCVCVGESESMSITFAFWPFANSSLLTRSLIASCDNQLQTSSIQSCALFVLPHHRCGNRPAALLSSRVAVTSAPFGDSP